MYRFAIFWLWKMIEFSSFVVLAAFDQLYEPVISVEQIEPSAQGNKQRKDRKVIRIDPGTNEPGFDIEMPEKG